MANQKIHEYILERFSIGDDDYFDIDYFDGTNYTSAKVKGSVIKALASAINIYNTDGTLTADRILDGDGNTLTFDDLRQLEINVNPAPLGTPGVDINVMPSGPLMRVKDATSGDIRFEVLQSGEIRFNNAYQFPLNDGASGEVLTTDGLGNLTFQPVGGVDTNIYNSDGTLTANRTLLGNNFELFFQTLGAFIVHSHKNNIDNVVFEVRTQSGFDSFTIRDHNTGNNLFTINNGTIQILNEYFLPSVDGANGQVIVTDGAGNTSFQDVPNIYNNDGTLSGLRTLSGNQESLAFDNLGLFYVKINPPILQDWGVNVRVDTTNLTPGSDGTPFRVMRDQDNKILFASVEDGRVNVNEAYYLPSSAGTLGQVLASAGGSVVNWQSIYNQQIQDEGSNLTQRNIINFVGAGVTVTDVGSKTTVNIPGGTSLTDAWIPFSEPGLYATNNIFFMSTGIFSATESLVQMPFPACRIKNFKINVTSNTANNATTIEVRRNGVAILTTSIPGNTNGVFTATGLVSIAVNDLISIRVVIPSGGSSIGLRGAMLNYEI